MTTIHESEGHQPMSLERALRLAWEDGKEAQVREVLDQIKRPGALTELPLRERLRIESLVGKISAHYAFRGMQH